MTALRSFIVLAAFLAIAGFFTSQIKGFETLRDDGRIVFLELRPADPRALLLGDYMALRYEQGRLRRLDFKDLDYTDLPPNGTLVFRDDDGVAKFARIETGKLAPDEFKFAYVKWRNELNYGGPRFYFQNGTAKDYNAARYGVFKVDAAGKSVLVNLADRNRKIIKPKPK